MSPYLRLIGEGVYLRSQLTGGARIRVEERPLMGNKIADDGKPALWLVAGMGVETG